MATQRKRGYYLSDPGWERIWDAIHAEFPEGHGRTSKNDEYDRYNLPKIAALTQTGTGGSVSDETISKIIHRTEKTDKSKIQSLFKAFGLQLQSSDLTQDAPIAEPIKKDDPNFVGRESAIADLNALVAKEAKVILIYAAGGVGKTTFAKQYLKQRFSGEPLEFVVAKTRSLNTTITSVDGVLKDWLKDLSPRDYDSNINFKEALKQLKKKLTEKPIGILIDNLEPALEGNGQFIETYRESYLELLEILSNQEVRSITLITSRLELAEYKLVPPDFRSYWLKTLELENWKNYFQHSKNIEIDDKSLKKIYKYYNEGNALAMILVAERVSEEKINLETYWQRSNKGNRVKSEQRIKNLICEEFEFLKSRNELAYNLLCRLTCYRYQEVPEIPYEAFECLFWDEETDEQKYNAIQYLLENTVYINRGEQKDTYFLYPLIIEEGKERIKQDKLAWEVANRQAAEFWTTSIKTVETIKEATQVLEAYYHYFQIADYEQAANILVKERKNKFSEADNLLRSFYRLGLLDKITFITKNIAELISEGEDLALIYGNLGFSHFFNGRINEAIEILKKSRDLAIKCNLTEGEKILPDFDIGLCEIALGENEKALIRFNKIRKQASNPDDILLEYLLECLYFVLPFLYSSLKMFNEVREGLQKIQDIESIANSYSWGKFSKYLFIASIYKNLGDVQKSTTIYNDAIRYAEESGFELIKAKASIGLGELYRLQGEYQKAIDEYHLKSIEILDKIGAKCDLAEAYFQLALTYQAMGDQPNSQTYFNKALDLWGEKQINAPKQIERVKKAWLLDSPE